MAPPAGVQVVSACGTGQRALSSWGSIIRWWSPGSTKVAGSARSGRRNGPWPPSRPRSVRRPHEQTRTGRSNTSSLTSTPCCGVGGRTSGGGTPPEVHRHRQLRTRATGDPHLNPSRPLRTELGNPLHVGMVQSSRSAPTGGNGSLLVCACLAVNDVGEPCAGEPHARFDRGPLAKQHAMVRRKRCTQRETERTEPVHLPHDLTSQRPTSPPPGLVPVPAVR